MRDEKEGVDAARCAPRNAEVCLNLVRAKKTEPLVNTLKSEMICAAAVVAVTAHFDAAAASLLISYLRQP